MNGFAIYFTRVFDFAHAFQILTIGIAAVTVLSPVKPVKKNIAFAALKILCVCAGCIFIESFLFFLANMAKGAVDGIVFPLTYLFVLVLYAVFFCKFDIKQKLISASLLFASIVMVTECIKNFAFLLPAGDLGISAAVVAISLINILTAFIFTKYDISRFISMPKAAVALVIVVSITSIVTEFSYSGLLNKLFQDAHRANLAYTAVSGSVLYVFILCFYLMFYFVLESTERVAQLQMQEKLMREDGEMLKVMQKTMSDIRQMRHELKNRCSYMKMLFDNGQLEELGGYLDSYTEEVLKPLPYFDCSNRTVANVLNLEKTKAEAHGINMIAELNVPPVLPFDDLLLCSVFTNLTDNAIEACERYGITGDVRVTATVRGDYFYIAITNPLPPDAETDKILESATLKEDVKEHGYGKRIVKKVAEKYDGMCSFSIERGLYIAETMLSLRGNV